MKVDGVLGRCSECEHVGTLELNDDVVVRRVEEEFIAMLNTMVVRRFGTVILCSFVWGVVIGAWLL